MKSLAGRLGDSIRSTLVTLDNGLAACRIAPGFEHAAIRCGIDLVDIEEFERALTLGRDRFLKRIFTSGERTFCRGRTARLAARFAAKEAAAKLLGTGIRGLNWQEIEIVSLTHGEPTLVLHDRAHARASALGLCHVALSLCHTRSIAAALVVGICRRRKTTRERAQLKGAACGRN
jgi:holo-[acyl-carrier protein] synthase